LKPTRGRSQRAYPAFSRAIVVVGLCAAVAACSPGQAPVMGAATAKADRGGVSWPPYKPRPKPQDPQIALTEGFRVVAESDPTVDAVPDPHVLEAHAQIVTGGGRYHVGRPYEVAGKLYKPAQDTAYNEVGMASWYGSQFHGRLTANGEIFDRTSISAAHPTMPLPSYVRVTNLSNNRSIVVRVNDRGPFRHNRLIDVSGSAAAAPRKCRWNMSRRRRLTATTRNRCSPRIAARPTFSHALSLLPPRSHGGRCCRTPWRLCQTARQSLAPPQRRPSRRSACRCPPRRSASCWPSRLPRTPRNSSV
jgi:rare lipoprotein A (peptidoglycan hydrolase)